MTALIDFIPDAETLLAFEPEELGISILRTLRSGFGLMGSSTPRFLLKSYLALIQSNYPPPHHEILEAVREAWAWLEGQGLLIPDLTWSEPHSYRVLSRRARKLAVADTKRALPTRSLARASLHRQLIGDTWELFVRGKYDTAVFEAFKAVEIYVRDASEIPAKEVGVQLMRKAFDKNTGPLRDSYAEESEREARAHLFAGAIGAYKNPTSHRRIGLDDPAEAAEMILLASHLLRLTDTAKIDRDLRALGDLVDDFLPDQP